MIIRPKYGVKKSWIADFAWFWPKNPLFRTICQKWQIRKFAKFPDLTLFCWKWTVPYLELPLYCRIIWKTSKKWPKFQTSKVFFTAQSVNQVAWKRMLFDLAMSGKTKYRLRNWCSWPRSTLLTMGRQNVTFFINYSKLFE